MRTGFSQGFASKHSLCPNLDSLQRMDLLPFDETDKIGYTLSIRGE